MNPLNKPWSDYERRLRRSQMRQAIILTLYGLACFLIGLAVGRLIL